VAAGIIRHQHDRQINPCRLSRKLRSAKIERSGFLHCVQIECPNRQKLRSAKIKRSDFFCIAFKSNVRTGKKLRSAKIKRSGFLHCVQIECPHAGRTGPMRRMRSLHPLLSLKKYQAKNIFFRILLFTSSSIRPSSNNSLSCFRSFLSDESFFFIYTVIFSSNGFSNF